MQFCTIVSPSNADSYFGTVGEARRARWPIPCALHWHGWNNYHPATHMTRPAMTDSRTPGLPDPRRTGRSAPRHSSSMWGHLKDQKWADLELILIGWNLKWSVLIGRALIAARGATVYSPIIAQMGRFGAHSDWSRAVSPLGAPRG